jgi:hypothetical protein
MPSARKKVCARCSRPASSLGLLSQSVLFHEPLSGKTGRCTQEVRRRSRPRRAVGHDFPYAGCYRILVDDGLDRGPGPCHLEFARERLLRAPHLQRRTQYYVTGGAGYVQFSSSGTTTSSTGAPVSTTGTSRRTAWVAGAGSESAVTPNVILRFEFLYLQMLDNTQNSASAIVERTRVQPDRSVGVQLRSHRGFAALLSPHGQRTRVAPPPHRSVSGPRLLLRTGGERVQPRLYRRFAWCACRHRGQRQAYVDLGKTRVSLDFLAPADDAIAERNARSAAHEFAHLEACAARCGGPRGRGSHPA